jgi:DNA-binding NtrC family response regulator
VIAATNRDLRMDVNRGAFREDLFHRLNVVSVRLPPLRERPEDIALLAEHFRRELTGDPDGALPAKLVEQLTAQRWPGNARELRNAVERELVMAAAPADEAAAARTYREAKAAVVDAFERHFLVDLLQRTGGNRSEAARVAAMDRPFLRKLLRKHGLD